MYSGKYSAREQRTMSHTKRNRRRPLRWSKQLTILACLTLLLTGFVGSSLAWLVSAPDPVTNTFEYAKVACSVVEEFDNNVKTNVQIKNDGNISAYIRAKIVATWQDADGNVYPGAPAINPIINSVDWTLQGEYYYCNTKVAAGHSTPVLINRCDNVPAPEDGYVLHVEILADAIQAEPLRAVSEAWDWTPITVSE